MNELKLKLGDDFRHKIKVTYVDKVTNIENKLKMMSLL